MATNKNAILRFNVLDKCFQNNGRKYYFDDLLEIVNDALFVDNPKSTGVQTRQLREDIRFMKSEAGYAAPIEAIKDNRKYYYRYTDDSFSITKSPLNNTEAEQLKNAVSVLQRFEGAPQFEWVGEIGSLLQDRFGLMNSSQKVMAYESNIDYTGHEHITQIFNAIVNERVLSIKYHPFGKDAFDLDFHPYYLKQYNNRWFVIGRNELLELSTWNLALDRIESIQEIDAIYVQANIDWEDFFYDMIGVTRTEGAEVEKVELIFDKQQAPYIQTKPVHPSQKSSVLESGELEVRIEVVINYELEMKLLSFGEKVKVVAPVGLKEQILYRLNKASRLY
jgi:predicted DNA-binding transcriptional regulator YafY